MKFSVRPSGGDTRPLSRDRNVTPSDVSNGGDTRPLSRERSVTLSDVSNGGDTRPLSRERSVTLSDVSDGSDSLSRDSDVDDETKSAASAGGGRVTMNSVDSGRPESVEPATTTATTTTSAHVKKPRGEDRSSSLASRGRLFAKRQTRRLVSKDGECNIRNSSVTDLRSKYLADIFTTLIDMRWRYIVFLFTLTFLTSWLLFAALWLAIAAGHGDMSPAARRDPAWAACVAGVDDFATALLFSIETQHTIGYGERVVTPACAEATLLLMLQACVGVLIQSLVTGLVFAKLSRPKRRSHTVLFSRAAVVCRRDGHSRLLFRVGDMRKSHIVGASIRAVFVQTRVTAEGETLPLCQSPLCVEADTSHDNYVSMLLPVTVSHRIDATSPLWGIGAERLLTERFEIVVILDGTVESTGMATQIRTSYLPCEVIGSNLYL